MTQTTEHNAPFHKFAQWLEDAENSTQIREPAAMCLSTVGDDGKPSSRMVLLKGFKTLGLDSFCFFTNLGSRKAKQLFSNPSVALCFYWSHLMRQVRIEGDVESVTDAEADWYFATRRRESRLGAIVSKQSQELESWEIFQEELLKADESFNGKEVTRPDNWSGFRVIPQRIEFWEEGDFRIHKRELFTKKSDGDWTLSLLYP